MSTLNPTPGHRGTVYRSRRSRRLATLAAATALAVAVPAVILLSPVAATLLASGPTPPSPSPTPSAATAGTEAGQADAGSGQAGGTGTGGTQTGGTQTGSGTDTGAVVLETVAKAPVPPAGQQPEPTGTPLGPEQPEQPEPHPSLLPPQPGYLAAPEPSPDPDGVVTNGGPTGCAAGCITKAWLTPRPASSDLNLEVRTSTAARIVATIGTQQSQDGDDAGPQITGEPVTASTGEDYLTEWSAVLAPLTPGARYHIVVTAQDANGGRSSRAGTITTVQPADAWSANEPGGCATSCVERALVTPRPGSPQADLTVATQVPATMAAYVSEHAPQTDDAGQPHFPGATPIATSGEQPHTGWDTTLELAHATTYHVLLQVTDEQHRSQFLTGRLTTPPEPLANHQNRVRVTFHKAHVTDDADNTFLNWRGELKFLFEINGHTHGDLTTGEHKVWAPEWVDLSTGGRSDGRSAVIEGAPDRLPIRVQAHERDRGSGGFCTAGERVFEEPSGRREIDGCDDVEWNTAAATVDLHQEVNDAALPGCYGHGDAIIGDICLILHATGEDPTFTVYVTIDFLE